MEKMEVVLVWVLLSFPLPHHQCSSAKGIYLFFFTTYPFFLNVMFYFFCLAFVILLFLASTWSKSVAEMNEISPSCLFIFIPSAAHVDLVSFKIALDHQSPFPVLLCIARHISFGLPLCGKSSFSPLD